MSVVRSFLGALAWGCRSVAMIAIVLVGVSVVAVGGVPVAGAAAAKPFGVNVTMQTTGPPREVFEVVEGATLHHFENPPVTFTQAGGHPYALTTTVEFPTELVGHAGGVRPPLAPTGDPRDIVTDLPPGLLGDPQAVPRCPLVQVVLDAQACPAATQIGVFVFHRGANSAEEIGPILNLTPEAGQSAEFGLKIPAGLTYLLTAHVVRSGSTYGLTVVSNGIPITELYKIEVTFWGDPASPSHDSQRGLSCGTIGGNGGGNLETCNGGNESSGVPEVPFLTMPADCAAGPLTTTVLADSWEHPGVYKQARATLPGVTGCNLLRFDPEIEATPDTLLADEPVGLGVNLKVPQVESRDLPAAGIARNVVVTLPEGLSISPGIVDGIQACNESGSEGINFNGPESEEIGLNGEPQLAPGHCPDASIVGTAEAETPLLANPLKGHVYLARPLCGGVGQEPCTARDALDGNLYQLYLELGGTGALADTGVNLKVHLKTEANPATGQLTTVAEGNPPFPYSELRVRLNGGPRSPLDNPAVCGPAATTSDFTPWSAPGITPEGLSMAGTPDVTPASFFKVEGCADPPGLHPGFVAGTVTPQAGQFSAFTLNLSRQDREQFVKGIQIHTPPGLLGMLSSIELCGEPEANDGHCPESSKIGTTRVASGAGSHPFEIEGSVYLTGPHDGAPFGLSVVTPAVAGPFNLGVVVVRARSDVDPEKPTLTVTTDEAGPYAVPRILDGVPLRLKRITVDIDRPGFMFNPTNCGAPGRPGTQQVSASVAGSENAVANVQSQFAVGGCRSLAFKPVFTVSTSGQTSRADGASLDAKVSYPPGSMGSEADIASVKVELPEQLPSRLTTLQKACAATTFATNPAGCPAASIVGIAKADTPVLPVGLEGPVYFVSHGGEAFPSLIVVLQGDGVRVDLTGSTFISKAGITSSTFKTIPDVPVNSFELYFPEGPYSALVANGNLCNPTSTGMVKHKVVRRVRGRTVHRTVTARVTQPASLTMPSEFVAQNGLVLKQNTKIAVTGCATAGKATAARAHNARAAGAHQARRTERTTIHRPAGIARVYATGREGTSK
jgi:hypothetical protein